MLPDAIMAAANVLRTAHAISERERTSDVLTEENSNVDFASMFLSEPVTLGLQKVGFEKPSPIQLKAIPLGRCGLDLIVQAKSGTGKTCVFSVIALEGIDITNPSTQVLVLAPTREIAVQIQDTIRAIGCEMEGLRCHVFIGGTLFGPDRQKMKKCHIAVGTPGRIKQLIEYEVLKTGAIRLFVLDEADKLLDDTFQEQVNWVYNHLSDNKQMLALSATYPEYLAKHLTKYMREPTFVRLNPKDLALRGIKQLYVELEGHSLPNKAFEIKVVKLLKILTQVSFSQCLIFSNLQTRAQNLCDILCDSGWPSECISGAQEQSQRLTAMAKLKKFQCRILISTDLTARGIDAENVNLIINLDIPTDTKTYLHRIGRAGRFGTHGAAISLASKGREMELLRNIQRHCRVMMTELPDPAPSDLLKQDLSSAGFQHVPIAFKSLLPAEKRDPTRNTTTDDHHDSSTSDDALFTSSDVSGEGPKQLQKCVKLIETENSVIPPVSDKPSFLQVGICASNVTTKDDADTSVDSKATKIVESIEDKHGVPETNRKILGAPKVDACIQTLPEDELHSKTMAPQFSNVSGNVNHRERRMLPFGFEDAPEVRKLCLPHWMQVKGGDAARRACTWYEGKESFEKFMRERAVNDGSRMSEKEEGKELLVETERHIGKADDASLSSGNADVASSKDVKANYDPQFKYKDEVRDSSECNTHDSVQTKTSGSTPIQEIERYKALFHKAFVCNLTGEEDTSTGTKLENHVEKIMVVTKAKETDSLESEKVNSVCLKQVAKEFGDGQGAKETDCESNLSSKQSFREAENVNQRKQETKDEMAEDLKVDSELQHQAYTDSLDMQSLHELKRETKSKTSNTTAVKKKLKQQRIRQHVFQMSTAGAFMSPKELDMAVINIPNTSSFDGDVDTTDIDRENIPLCNKGIRRHKVHHVKDSYKPEQEDALCNRRQEVSNEEVHGAEGSGKETRKNKEGEASVQEKVSKEKESSVSSLNDPVWAIFKNFIPSSLPSDVGRKETKPGSEENSSEQSSSSLCESDTSTCSSTSSEDDSSSSETDEEDEDSKEACESESKDEKEENESGVARNGKQHIRPSKAKEGVDSNDAETYDGLNGKYHYCKGQHKDGQYPLDPSWTMESHFYQSGFNVEGYEYGGSGESLPYYPAAPVAEPRYQGWQYPCNSAQYYPNTYWNDYYNGYTQQPYHGYSYFPSSVPPYI